MSIKAFHKLSGEMAVHGTLLLIFGMLLLAVGQVGAVEQVDRAPIYMIPTWLIPSPPACFCLALKIILIIVSPIFVFAIIWLWRKYKLADYLKRWPKPIAYLILCFVRLLVLSILLFILWLIPPIPPAPDLFYNFWGGFALLISLAFMIAVFCEGLAGKFEKVVKGRFQWIYWFIFLLVYIASVSQGLSKLDKESLVYHLLDYFSFAWSVVIMILFFKSFLAFLQEFMAGKKPAGIVT